MVFRALFAKSILVAAALGFLLTGMAAGTAGAQTRSDTGRHQPPPPPVEEEAPIEEQDSPGPDTRNWAIGFSGGIQGGSELFRVEVLDGAAVPWDSDTGGGFQSSRYTTSLDRNFSFGIFLSREISSHWSLRADFGYSRMDVAAEALTGQNGAVFLFDRFSVVNLGLGVEAKLVRAKSYPYLNASFLVSRLGPARAEGLEQTNLGARVGLGYLYSIQDLWGLRVEGRLARTGFSVGDYVPQAEGPDQPLIEYDSEDHLYFYEFLIGVQVVLN